MRLRHPVTPSSVHLFGALLLALAAAASAQQAWVKDDAYTAPRAEWYRTGKYGMFIHWGVYSVPAGYYHGKPVDGIGEWIMNNARIPIPEYEQFTKQFDPEKFDARAWARTAKAAGMRYMVITSKHHDGFSMFGTKVNGYNIVDATPFKRDPMKELSDACKAEGLKFCFYHSIMDWHHPELAPAPGGATEADDPRVQKYVEGQLKPQLKELVTKYDPAILWFDGEWVPWWSKERGREIEAYLHALKPEIIVNNRVGKRGLDDGDYETPEQEIPRAALGKRLWETCMTLNDTWGYKRDDHNWKQPEDVLRKLADISGKGGNFLLNVGPTDEGLIPAESVQILKDAGEWLKRNGECIYGTTYAVAQSPSWGSITRKGNRLYLIVFDYPKEGQPLQVPITNRIRRVALLHGKSVKVEAEPGPTGCRLSLPSRSDEKYAQVVTVDFEGELQPVKSAAERTAAGEPVAVEADGSILLKPGTAAIHGGSLKVEQKGGADNLGFWTDRGDYPTWYIEPKQAGRYQVELTYACEPKSGGGYTIAFGTQKLPGEAESTGSWTSFKRVRLGVLDLPAAKCAVTVKSTGEFRGALMNLQSLKLMPVR